MRHTCIKKKSITEKINKYTPKTEQGNKKNQDPIWVKDKTLRKTKRKYFAFKYLLITIQCCDYDRYISKICYRNKICI